MWRARPARIVVVCLLLAPLATGRPVLGQEREIEEAALPRNTSDRILGIVNDPATLRLPGGIGVPADSVLPGDVVVMGDFRLAGRVEGDLIVVHGDLHLEPGASVEGDLTVVDGEILGAEAARVGGTLIAYRRESRFVQRGDRARHLAGAPRSLERAVPAGSSFRFSVRATDYNRVEGLPVEVGPVLDTGGRNPLRADTRVVWRSQGHVPLATDRLGYRVTVEQFVGGRRTLRVGVGAHSLIEAIEEWELSDREHAWSTLLLATDQRDHYERRGWRAFLRATPRSAPVDATLELRSERHGSVAAADPWALIGSRRSWRAQPVAAEGSLRSVVGAVALDTRDDHLEPQEGWLVRAGWEQGVGGRLILPPAVRAGDQDAESPGEPPLPPAIDPRFGTAALDLRRYQPIGQGGALAVRGLVAGTPSDRPLPPQRQFALGGVGSLPGHAPFSGDCAGRETRIDLGPEGPGTSMFPFYGCDRVALLQVEYRGPLHLDLGFGPPSERERWRRHHGGPSWAVFVNAGRGWAAGDWGDVPRAHSPTLRDAGVGLLLGRGGAYWAVPLGEGVRGSTLTVRLDRRF
jgi:hypothetical protein